MKKITKYLALIAIIISVSSCEEYLDINEDPINPTADSTPPDLLLAGALAESYAASLPRGGNQLGNLYMQSWAGDATNFTGAFQNEYALDLNASFYSSIWDGLYLRTATFQTMIDNNDPAYTNYNAISRIMKSYYMQYIVDLYGDAPYSQAHKLGSILTPTYDVDSEIYGELLSSVNTAIDLINNPSLDAITPSTEDIVYQGNMQMWLKFANTLKLKLLVRQKGSGIYNSQFASLNGASFIGMGEDVTINPGYQDAENKQNPHYNLFYAVGGTANQSRTLVVGSDYALKFLTGGVTENAISTSVYDNRVTRLYEPVDGDFVGIQQGANSIPGNLKPAKIGPGIVISSSQDGYLMTAAEALLLQAEARNNGDLTSGPAADVLFRDAIRSSFSLLGATDVENYINLSENTNRIGWTGTANKIEAIQTQKWIALNGINGLESWIEYTRTGYPAVPLAITAGRAARPNRLLYPSSEYAGNSANVPEQTEDSAFNTKIFWDVN
ncbi:SusD/RagB family nutrient-binding outer membrane lipoprotein [Lacinutrix sp. WUR7]|uniref:SusD/RagB family nutrient-binding outer membrane lipoprotein n=1 Tax=Lacinutrix sp. WUR7 TaxID=2653681 RepID=UPI00193D162D|nr:SusD/RagB family nutrient-binding outer membrane lipoprotein [Lacinutrix sp. WUR7]QRM88038.1 SusD/RagB family nutrient-binding outer membrane lipoprotein [Lacinutrix sp. WUR7]